MDLYDYLVRGDASQDVRLRQGDIVFVPPARRLISVSLERTAEGEPAENPRLEGQDQVILFPKRNLREERVVSVGGWVREPRVYPYVEGMTVADLVLQAGGLRTGAYLGEAQVSRVVVAQERTDTLTRTLEVALDTTLVFDGTTARGLRARALTVQVIVDGLAGHAEPPGDLGFRDALADECFDLYGHLG